MRSLVGGRGGMSPTASGAPEAQVQLQEIARELADTPPLTAAQRALWTAASTEPTASRPLRMWVYPAGLAAAAVLVAAIGLKLWGPQPGGRVPPPIVVEGPRQHTVPRPDPPIERNKLAVELLAKVDRLERELTELRREGDLLDVRKDSEALWARYGSRKSSTL